MSVKYTIKVSKSWDEVKEKIVSVIRQSKLFRGEYDFAGNHWYELCYRKLNADDMPDIGIIIRDNDVYISRYDVRDIWYQLDELRLFLEKYNVTWEELE